MSGAPPRLLAAALRLALPRGLAGETVAGDLREEHGRRARLHGGRAAARWYRREAASTALRFIALRAARGLERARDRLPRARGGGPMRDLISDARFALRGALARPLFATTVVLTLALGIGVNTAIFTVVDALLLRPLPVAAPERLLAVYTSGEGGAEGIAQSSTSWLDFVDLRAQSEAFEDLAAHSLMFASLGEEGGRSELVIGELVSANYFDVLGVRPALGRGFLPEENRSELSHPVAVLGHDLWLERFGGDPAALGARVRLNGRDYTVVGVAPPGFAGTTAGLVPALWIPTMMAGAVEPLGMNDTTRSATGNTRLERRGWRWLFVTGRLRDGVTREQAQAELATIAARLERDHPVSNTDRTMSALPAGEVRIHPLVDRTLFPVGGFLLALVGLVLLVACANVAGMMLARATGRRREIAVRLALGAGRGRLVRLLLVESLLLSLAGGALGLLLSLQGTRLLAAVRPPLPMALRFDLSPDLRVALFALGLAVATGVLFGLAPALQATRTDLVPDLKEGAAVAGARRRFGLRPALVVAQVAVSLVLLVGAGLVTRGLLAARATDLGFDAGRLSFVSLHLGMHGYSREEAGVFYDELLRRARGLPGVEAASLTMRMPFSMNVMQNEFYVGAGEVSREEPGTLIDVSAVREGYFETLGVPVIEGRGITRRDGPDAPPVAVVSAALARRYWPGESAVGRYLTQRDVAVLEIVGVVADHKVRTVGEEPRPVVFFAQRQRPHAAATAVVRSAAPGAALEALRREALTLEPDLTFVESRTMAEQLAVPLFGVRATAVLLAAFGAFGLLLASVGLYGVTAWSVAARTREIGTRMALGARRGDVLRLVLGEGMALVAVGALLGVLAAAALSRVLASLLFGVSPLDPLAFACGVAVLAGVALLASFVPARRAARVDPAVALRWE